VKKKNFLKVGGILVALLVTATFLGCPNNEVRDVFDGTDTWTPMVPPPPLVPGEPAFSEAMSSAALAGNVLPLRERLRPATQIAPHVWFSHTNSSADIVVNRFECVPSSPGGHTQGAIAEMALACFHRVPACDCFFQVRNWRNNFGGATAEDGNTDAMNGRIGTVDDPIIVRFTASFDENQAFFMGAYANAANTAWVGTPQEAGTIHDPLRRLYQRLPNRTSSTAGVVVPEGGWDNDGHVVLDFSAATFTGVHPDIGILHMTSTPAYNAPDVIGNANTPTAVTAGVRPDNGRMNLVGLALPRTMRYIPNHWFQNSGGLRRISLRGLSELLEIGSSAFAGIGHNGFVWQHNPRSIDFSGANSLMRIGASALNNAGANLRTWDSRNAQVSNESSTGPIPLSSRAFDLSILPNLISISDNAFQSGSFNTPTLGNQPWTPAAPHPEFGQLWGVYELHFNNSANILDIGMGSFDGANNIRRMFFHGTTLTDAGWRSLPGRNGGGGPNLPGAGSHLDFGLPMTHRWEGWNGDIGQFTNFVLEVFMTQQVGSRRPFPGFLAMADDDGIGHGQEQIPMHPEFGDIYRGQPTMAIQARVSGAGGGTNIALFSRPDSNPRYRVGTMNNGWVTLTTPDQENVRELNEVSGMEITFDPGTFHTTAHGLLTGSEHDLGMSRVEGLPHEYTVTGAARWHWEPSIGDMVSGIPAVQPNFIQVVSLFFQDSNNEWHEIRRSGNDTFVDHNNYALNRWWTDQRDIVYVWVDRDVTIRRIHRRSSGINMGDMQSHGHSLILGQSYYVLGHPNMHDPSRRGQPLRAGFWGVKLSLRQGWNQLERLSRFTQEDVPTIWAEVEKSVNVSAGIQGPFAIFDAGNTTNFNVRAGKAYNPFHADLVVAPVGQRAFTDEGNYIQVPWIWVHAE